MAYDKFTTLTTTAVPLTIENVDTDQIIPARFLKATERVGFGDNLFRDWSITQTILSKKILYSTILSTKEKFSLVVRTLGLDHLENTLPGPFTITDLDVLYLAFLQTFLKTIA